ncbi:MAG: RHS repeat-associated core domain-containing protein [Opitutaceae bacterium]
MEVEYDPFGNIISSGTLGSLVGDYGFSTKPMVDGLDWYYYGFRYYDAETGRWPSRDPIEEEGGLNVYGMVGGDPINWIDLLGLLNPPLNPGAPAIPYTDELGNIFENVMDPNENESSGLLTHGCQALPRIRNGLDPTSSRLFEQEEGAECFQTESQAESAGKAACGDSCFTIAMKQGRRNSEVNNNQINPTTGQVPNDFISNNSVDGSNYDYATRDSCSGPWERFYGAEGDGGSGGVYQTSNDVFDFTQGGELNYGTDTFDAGERGRQERYPARMFCYRCK